MGARGSRGSNTGHPPGWAVPSPLFHRSSRREDCTPEFIIQFHKPRVETLTWNEAVTSALLISAKAVQYPRMIFSRAMIDVLASADRVVALTGAGVSAESGVPTFREAQTGLWARFRPEELATPEAFRANPKRVWEWYAWRREQVASVNPNPAHFALAEWQKIFPGFVLVTQNVDGLHQRAGSRGVIELHGNINRTKCFEEDRVISNWEDTGDIPPRCPDCGGRLRPDVVWFGERLPEQAMSRALTESTSCDVLLSIGTSALVYPAAMLPYAALQNKATVVEINPQPSPLAESADFVLTGMAGKVLSKLTVVLKNAVGNRHE